MKYAFLIPIYNTISGRLLPQFLNLQEWCPQLDGKIYTIVGRTHADARNWLCTDGGGFSNPNKLIDKVDYSVLCRLVCERFKWYCNDSRLE